MSDYLGNLIGKSFGQVGVVTPRRAPLFAPSPYLTGALAQAGATTPADDGPLLPSRRAWVATEAQPDAAASDAQEPPDGGQWLSVSTDAMTAFGTADTPLTAPSGLQIAPLPGGTPISPSEKPESSAPRVRTRRRSGFAGQDQTQPQRQTITLHSEGDDFDSSETPQKPIPSANQGELTRRDATKPPVAQERSVQSSDNTRAAAPRQEPARLQPIASRSSHAVHQDQTAPAQARPEARAQGRAPASEASASRLADIDRRSQPPGSIAGATANGSRLATIRTAVRVASVTAQDAATGGHTEPAQMETNLTPGEARPASAAHPLSPARLTGALAAQLATLQSGPPQQAPPDGPAPGRVASMLRPALRSAQQESAGEPWPTAVRTSTRAGIASDNAPAPVQQTIHVTIGRIEVRATPPPSAPARKQTAAPVMSLDEYLKSRSGGQR